MDDFNRILPKGYKWNSKRWTQRLILLWWFKFTGLGLTTVNIIPSLFGFVQRMERKELIHKRHFLKLSFNMARRKYRGEISLNFMLKAERRYVFSFEEQRNNSTTQSKNFKDNSYNLISSNVFSTKLTDYGISNNSLLP